MHPIMDSNRDIALALAVVLAVTFLVGLCEGDEPRMPTPRFPCDCAATGECYCGPSCTCRACHLARENCELKAKLKAASAQPVRVQYEAATYQPVRYYSPAPVYRPLPYQYSLGGFQSTGPACVGGT